MYFFENNKAVGGCQWKDQEEDPGNVEFDWLDQQLKAYRERGVKVSGRRRI
jgi:endopolyphosphatase